MSTSPETPASWQPTAEDLHTFQTHLRAILETRRVSQNHVEGLAGLSRGTLSKVFSGKLHISRRHTGSLAEALETSEHELLSGTSMEPLLSLPLDTPESEALQAAHSRINLLEQELSASKADREASERLSQDLEREIAMARVRLEAVHVESERLGGELIAASGALATVTAERNDFHDQLRTAQEHGLSQRRSFNKLKVDLEETRAQLAVSQAAEQDAVRWKSELEGLQAELRAASRAREAAEVNAKASHNRAEKERAIAVQARKQAEEWAKHAAAETSRAEQLQNLVLQIQEQARAKANVLSAQVGQAKAEAQEKVSPGAALLIALAGAGLGAALSSGSGSKRRY